MQINKAAAKDLQSIFKLLQDAGSNMRSNGIMQWNENYPTIENVQNDLKIGNLYLLKIHQDLVGVISIDNNQSPEYESIDWKYTAGKVMVVHRLAVAPNFQKKGIGKILMDFALDYALQNNYTSIRLDAYSKNERTLNFYRNRKYEYRGDIYFPYREDPFYCFEKLIKI